MKSLRMLLFFSGLCLLYACGYNNTRDRNEDDQKVAEDQNDQRFDNDMEDDAQFAVDAAEGGMLEIQAAELAAINSSSKEVKDLSRIIQSDHTKANEELTAMAGQKHITLPDDLGNEAQGKLNELAKLRGNDFDKAYCDLMIKDHKRAIDNFKEEAQEGSDDEIKVWATGKVSTLEHHLSLVQNMAKDMKER